MVILRHNSVLVTVLVYWGAHAMTSAATADDSMEARRTTAEPRTHGSTSRVHVQPVTVDGRSAVAAIPATFVSLGWEMWKMMDLLPQLSDSRLRRVASHLSPAVVRVGGITADWVRYTQSAGQPTPPPPPPAESSRAAHADARRPAAAAPFWPQAERNLSMPMFEQLLDFMAASKLSLLFDLSALHGRDCHSARPGCNASAPGWHPPCNVWCTGRWDTTNVRAFLQYLHDHHLASGGSPLYAFEVGNELITHESAEATTAEIVALAAIIQSIWSDVRAPAAHPSGPACRSLYLLSAAALSALCP